MQKNGPKITILVDALDEAASLGSGESLVDLLSNLGRLPSRLKFTFTTRPETAVLRHFESQNIPFFYLDAGREDNRHDVRRYIQNYLSKYTQINLASQEDKQDEIIERLVRASQGNFLYLTWLLPVISADITLLEQGAVFPVGLDGIYREFFRTRRTANQSRWETHYRPVLGVLAAARSSLGLDQIVMMTGLSRQIARDSLRELDQFLNPLLRLKGEYQLYHQSIIDFLADESALG